MGNFSTSEVYLFDTLDNKWRTSRKEEGYYINNQIMILAAVAVVVLVVNLSDILGAVSAVAVPGLASLLLLYLYNEYFNYNVDCEI